MDKREGTPMIIFFARTKAIEPDTLPPAIIIGFCVTHGVDRVKEI